jgi:predicted nucleic acid-binding Zn ribbon protein
MNREHNTASLECWCQPTYYAGCPDCGPQMSDTTHMSGLRTISARVCPTCAASDHRGLVRVTLEAMLFRGDGLLIVHNDTVS